MKRRTVALTVAAALVLAGGGTGAALAYDRAPGQPTATTARLATHTHQQRLQVHRAVAAAAAATRSQPGSTSATTTRPRTAVS